MSTNDNTVSHNQVYVWIDEDGDLRVTGRWDVAKHIPHNVKSFVVKASEPIKRPEMPQFQSVLAIDGWNTLWNQLNELGPLYAGLPPASQPTQYFARLLGRAKWESVSKEEFEGYQNGRLYETKTEPSDPAEHERWLREQSERMCEAVQDQRDELQRQLDELKVPAKYDDTLLPFLAMMRMELHANAHKGDREGWLSMTTGECLLEIYWHTSKLQRALRDNERDGIREFSADIANLCMMMVDVAGALGVQDPATPGPRAHHQPSACSHPHRIAHFDKGEITAEVCQQCGDVQKREQPLSTFTVFCREANNQGTTWIGTVEARDVDQAIKLGAVECAVEWGSGGQNWSLDDIAVIGVAEGNVNILAWDDIE